MTITTKRILIGSVGALLTGGISYGIFAIVKTAKKKKKIVLKNSPIRKDGNLNFSDNLNKSGEVKKDILDELNNVSENLEKDITTEEIEKMVSEIISEKNEPVEENDIPNYVRITSGEFILNTDYDNVLLTYYDGDGVIASDYDEVYPYETFDNPELSTLVEGLVELLQTGDAEAVYFRDRIEKKDYEITKDPRSFREILRKAGRLSGAYRSDAFDDFEEDFPPYDNDEV